MSIKKHNGQETFKDRKTANGWIKEIRSWTLSLGIAVLISVLFQNYVYAQTEVYNISMQNTLVEGQRLIEDKWSYRFTGPAQGDIVLINGPEYKERLVKRVVALAGQVVDIRDGALYVDGVRLAEPYAKGSTQPLGAAMPLEVPAEHVYVLGDNRENSMDSRSFGPVALSSLEGKAVLRVWPIVKFGSLH